MDVGVGQAVTPILYNLSTCPVWRIRAPANLDKTNPNLDKSSTPDGTSNQSGQDVSRIRARGKPPRNRGFSYHDAIRIVRPELLDHLPQRPEPGGQGLLWGGLPEQDERALGTGGEDDSMNGKVEVCRYGCGGFLGMVLVMNPARTDMKLSHWSESWTVNSSRQS